MSSLQITRQRPQNFDQCQVCLKGSPRTGVYAVFSCSGSESAHAYCIDCIQDWAAQQSICPLCKSGFSNKAVKLLKDYKPGNIELIQGTLYDTFIDLDFFQIQRVLGKFAGSFEEFESSGIAKRLFLAGSARSIEMATIAGKAVLDLGVEWVRMKPVDQLKFTAFIFASVTIFLMAAVHLSSLVSTNTSYDAMNFLMLERHLFKVGAFCTAVANPIFVALTNAIKFVSKVTQNFSSASVEERLQAAFLISSPILIKAAQTAFNQYHDYGYLTRSSNEQMKNWFLTFSFLSLFIVLPFTLYQHRHFIWQESTKAFNNFKNMFDQFSTAERVVVAINISLFAIPFLVGLPLMKWWKSENWVDEDLARKQFLEGIQFSALTTAGAAAIGASRTLQGALGRVGRVVGEALVLCGEEIVNRAAPAVRRLTGYIWKRAQAFIEV